MDADLDEIRFRRLCPEEFRRPAQPPGTNKARGPVPNALVFIIFPESGFSPFHLFLIKQKTGAPFAAGRSLVIVKPESQGSLLTMWSILWPNLGDFLNFGSKVLITP